MFKSITRDKRNHLAKKKDEGPPILHYKPNFTNVSRKAPATIFYEDIKSPEKKTNQKNLCGKMV